MRPSRPNWTRALGLAIALAGPGARAQLALTNGAAVNVTPGGFSVVATLPAALPASAAVSIGVFADPNGLTNLAGQVGVNLYPLNSGALGATNDFQRQQSAASLQTQAMAHGLVYAAVSDCLPATTYYYQIKVLETNGLSGVWPAHGLAAVTTARENAFAIQSSQLLVTLNDPNATGAVLTLSNTNTATVLAAVVGDGAAPNQAFFSINDLITLAGNNSFAPLGNQTFDATLLGSSGGAFSQKYALVFNTNFVVSQTAQFSVGEASATVGFGRDAERAGASGSVAITITASGLLANCSFLLNVPTNRFSSLSLQTDSPLIGSATMQALSANSLRFSVQASAGNNLQGSAQVAHLSYTLATNDTSEFLNLSPTSLVGTNTDFSSANVSGQLGVIIIVGPQPILDTAISGSRRELLLYGIAGHSYQLQSSTNLDSSNAWTNVLRVPLTNLVDVISNLDFSSHAIFYRAYDFTADGPTLDAVLDGNGQTSLTLYGTPGWVYEVDYASAANGPWKRLGYATMTNAFAFSSGLPGADPNVFYRAEVYHADPPVAQAAAGVSGRSLLALGLPGATYTLQVATNFSGTVQWKPLLTYTLTNAYQYFNNLGSASSALYRIKKN